MDALLFDLDNTLYAPERDLFSLIDVRINRYMEEIVAIPAADVDGLRRNYWKAYGATLQGLIRHYAIDPEDYLEYVHDVDVNSRLTPDQALCDRLQQLGGGCYIFTNGSRGHAERVLAALGLSDVFEDIFDIRMADYQPKPCPDPYHSVLQKLGVRGDRCVMVEDSIANLQTAKQLEMTTVLVGDCNGETFIDHRVNSVYAAAELLSRWR